jgi:flagellar protein FlaG
MATIVRAAERVNEAARALGQEHLQLRVHEGTQRITIRVVDERTNEVVREFPPEHLLDALAAMEAAIGILIDEKA